MVSEPTLESLIRQVAGGGDTMASGIIHNGQRSGGADTKSAGYYPTMDSDPEVETRNQPVSSHNG